MTRIVVILAAAIFLYFLSIQLIGLHTKPAELFFKIDNTQAHSALIAKLNEKGVKHRVDRESRVWFFEGDEELVHALASEAMSSTNYSTITVEYEDVKFIALLEQELIQHKVRYESVVLDGTKQIRLYSDDRQEWAPIVSAIDELVISEKRKAFELN